VDAPICQHILVWASFPCQDLSLAGGGAGLSGARSGTFYAFWDVVKALITDGRAPKIIALENVCGTLTSHGGNDFQTICQTFADAGYRFGAIVVNASLFVPQSRSRLFLIGVHAEVKIDPSLVSPGPIGPFHTRGLCTAKNRLSVDVEKLWHWWNLPTPSHRSIAFSDIIESSPQSVNWHSVDETSRLLGMMTPVNIAKVTAATRARRRMVGGVYRRTRPDESGNKIQRAEVRFDDVAGCLRTPAGGSSRQTILVVEGSQVRSRLLSTREAARLMGLPDDYILPKNYNEAYHLAGDGVVVPVVRHITAHLFEPILDVAPIEQQNEMAA
jgi:DNA (cytosine-5)-methyltransferase 1